MAWPIVYDITRLGSRVLSSSPNGVHRVDATLAGHVLNLPDRPIYAAWLPRPWGHRIVSREAGLEVLDGIDGHFDESDDPRLEPIHQEIRAWILDGGDRFIAAESRLIHRGRKPIGRALRWLARNGLGRPAAETLPRGARYLNASHFGLIIPGAFDWLGDRRDVRAAFFLHDLLPLETPEYFRPRETARHELRLAALARHGAGAIVSTRVVEASLRERLRGLGRGDLPILVAPIPVAPIFRRSVAADPALAARPYFIQCGTIEPRKNHLTTLHVWRDLVARHGAAAPKLLLIGKRGWENENVLDLLDRSRALRRHVLEISGLPTPVLRRLLASARALLMPSFAEGFGLPLAEALAAGAPAIASDIPVFHEIAGGAFTPVGPIDGVGWRRAIENLSGLGSARPPERNTPCSSDPKVFFERVVNFLDAL
jgi:glycosyltransferase involved in cell wall biosynthesis